MGFYDSSDVFKALSLFSFFLIFLLLKLKARVYFYSYQLSSLTRLLFVLDFSICKIVGAVLPCRHGFLHSLSFDHDVHSKDKYIWNITLVAKIAKNNTHNYK